VSSWYSLLGLEPAATSDEITGAVERMSRQANALSVTAPERARLLRDQVRAIRQDLLSGPEQRARYDAGLARQAPTGGEDPGTTAGQRPAAGAQAQRPGGLMSRVAQFLQSGWKCQNCGHDALPADKFCPRCGSRIEPGLPGRGAGADQADRRSGTPDPARPCQNCGSGFAPGDAFCIRCGAPRV
jgi:hypothetical protein